MASKALVLLLLSTRIGSAAGKELLKGISYGPSPLKGSGRLPNDDFMSPSAKAQWSTSGRGDLQIMKKLGANAVRLYGNDPREDHKPFLDEAATQGLEVIPGMSDYPYTQMPDNCMQTDFNCYSQLKDQYKSNLQNGFVDKDGAYHPALKTIIVINEPDLKIPGISKPAEFCRAIISAIDGMIDAEKETGTKSNLVNFTATFSFAPCAACGGGSTKPSVGQMLALRRAMENPKDVGYTAKNNLAEVYKTRFTNSFNTNNPATDMKPIFLNDYEANFDSTPVFIGEYHSTYVDTKKDVQAVMDIAKESDALVGVSFFEFQVRYDKGGAEMAFGMFGLGQQKLSKMNFFGVEFPVWCLMKVADKKDPNQTIVDGVAQAFEGSGVNDHDLCLIDPKKVPLSEDGYQAILSLKSVQKMATFIERVIQHMGGEVADPHELNAFAQKYSTLNSEVTVRMLAEADLSFASMTSDLGKHPTWVIWDEGAACVADRSSDESSVGEAISVACGQVGSFNCTDLPSFCSKDIWTKADYVLSLFYYMLKDKGSPLRDCNFDGAAMFATTKIYRNQDSTCVITKDPATTSLSEEGYQTARNDTHKAAIFIEREIRKLDMEVENRSGLMAFAGQPPPHFQDLQEELPKVPWVCGGPSGRNCPVDPSGGGGSNAGWEIGLVVVILLLIAAIGATMYVRRKRNMAAAREIEQPLSEA